MYGRELQEALGVSDEQVKNAIAKVIESQPSTKAWLTQLLGAGQSRVAEASRVTLRKLGVIDGESVYALDEA